MKLLLIKWYDTTSWAGWRTLTAAKELEPVVNITVGWLIQDTSRFLTLAASYNETPAMEAEEELVSDVWVLPKAWVFSMEELGIPK